MNTWRRSEQQHCTGAPEPPSGRSLGASFASQTCDFYLNYGSFGVVLRDLTGSAVITKGPERVVA